MNAAILAFLPLIFRDPVQRAIHSPWHRGFFAGWDRRVLICAIVWIPAGWTATTLVKRCSNLLKTISQCTSSVLTYIFSMFPLTLVGPPLTPEPLSSPVILLAISVLLSALTFGGASAAISAAIKDGQDWQRQRVNPNRYHQSGSGNASMRTNGASALPEAGVDTWHVDPAYRRALPCGRHSINEH